MSARDCIARLSAAAGRDLSDSEVEAIFSKIHTAALDIKAGRAAPEEVGLGKQKGTKALQAELAAKGQAGTADTLIQQAAQRAAQELQVEAAQRLRQANLQAVRMGGTMSVWRALTAGGIKPMQAVDMLIARDFSGKANVESIEQRVAGYRAEFERKLLDTWDALGKDMNGFWQDRTKLVDLIKELRGEDSGNPLAKKGAAAFKTVAEEARQAFNANGGVIGKLDDWGFPQHHSQELVAAAGRDTWIDAVMPMLDKKRYVDDAGQPRSEADLRAFLGKAWDTIATNGMANIQPGEFTGTGKRANQHAESRQIHFKDADSLIDYWQKFGERSAFEILHGHVGTMARDIAFIEKFGPNPDTTFRTLRDTAVREEAIANPAKLGAVQRSQVKLDNLWNYASGKTKPSANLAFSGIADAIANLNVAGKLGGAAIASFFGDKPMLEAVSHLNDLPEVQRWRNEIMVLNPANRAERKLLMRQGLMLDAIRSGMNRFYDGLGKTSATGKLANAVMRLTGMVHINEARKAGFGLTLMDSIGNEVKTKEFSQLHETDIRTLRHFGIEEADWKVWKLAKLEDYGGGNDAVLTPDSIGRIADAELKTAGLTPDDRRNAVVKLLGAINTESEFAIVTPGWKERALFYGSMQRGTFMGEVTRSALQFKSFPWAYFQRGMDAVANQEGPVSKAGMTAYLITASFLAGAMIMQTRDVLSGKDPRKMFDGPKNAAKFWGAAFLQGGALGIYGDFLYSINQTRYGSGPLEAMAGPTLGPLLEMGLVQPLTAAKNAIDGKETHLLAQTLQDIKGFIPGGNIWYAKVALDHMIFQRAFEALSPGYLGNMRRKMQRDYNQDWWWNPGELSPRRAPNFEEALK